MDLVHQGCDRTRSCIKNMPSYHVSLAKSSTGVAHHQSAVAVVLVHQGHGPWNHFAKPSLHLVLHFLIYSLLSFNVILTKKKKGNSYICLIDDTVLPFLHPPSVLNGICLKRDRGERSKGDKEVCWLAREIRGNEGQYEGGV